MGIFFNVIASKRECEREREWTKENEGNLYFATESSLYSSTSFAIL